MSAASGTYSKRSKGYLPVNSGQVMIFGVFELGLLKKFGLSNRHRRCVGEFVSAQNAVPNEFQHLLSCLKNEHVNILGDCDEAFARIIIRRSPFEYHLILNLPDWALFMARNSTSGTARATTCLYFNRLAFPFES